MHTEADYIDVFRKLNRAYVNNYECLIDEHLILTAQKILGKEIMDKGKVLNIVKTYRKEKYSNLFKSLIPQIRNSIQHQNYLIDPKQPRITFYDKRKKPLSLTLNEYKDVCRRNLCLICAFDVAYFDLATNLLKVLLETVDVVDEYLKKHKLMLSPSNKEKGVSIADLALLIKSSKFG